MIQAKRLQSLSRLLAQHLPLECEGHYHVANIRQGNLVVITDSPVWTTRLRQLAPTILDVLKQAGVRNVQHVLVSSRIHYQPVQAAKPKRVKHELSQQSSELIDNAADCINDEGLKRALKKLARHR